MGYRRAFGRIAATSALCILATGCGQKKIAECNALVQVINTGVVRLEKAPKNETDATGITDLKAIADAMDKVAADAGQVQVTLKEVKRFRDDYQKMVRDIAKAGHDLAAAAQEKDTAKQATAQSALDAAVKQEDPLVDQINKYCLTP